MRVFEILLAVAGFVVGLAAALYWWKASRIDAAPVWGDREPVDPMQSQAGWIAGMLSASSEAARLNQWAALLSGVAVLLSTGSSLVALFT